MRWLWPRSFLGCVVSAIAAVLGVGGLALMAAGDRGDGTPMRHPPEPPPADITVAYVATVMGDIDQVLGDALRDLSPADGLRTVYAAGAVAPVVEELASLPPHGASPLDPVTTVDGLVRADRRCVVMAARRAFAALPLIPVPDPGRRWVTLVPRPPAAGDEPDPRTWWLVAYDRPSAAGGGESDARAACGR